MLPPTLPADGWTFPVAVADDELLSSWLSRSAHRHGTMPYPFLSHRFPARAVWDRDVDLTAGPDFLSALERAASLPPGSAATLTLRPFAATLSTVRPGRPWSGHVPWLLSAGVWHRKRDLHALQHCPACLAEGEPAYVRRWRLAFVVSCDRHGCLLRDGCPGCDAPVVPHRAPIERLDSCHACGHALRLMVEGTGGPCALATEMQRRCLSALVAGGAEVPGMACSGSDYLVLARTLAALLATSGSPLSDVDDESSSNRRQVERMRTSDRSALLGRLAAWTADWPRAFAAHAEVLGLSRLSFQRRAMPSVLAAEVAKLPDGYPRPRSAWRSALDDPGMRRLRRLDGAAYRAERACRLLAATAG